jgi:hypothetical protein
MPKSFALVVLVLAVGLALPVFAGDAVDVPTGNMVAPRHVEINYIYWDVDFGPSPAPQQIHIGEVFVGITDWLEVDGIVAEVDNDKTYARANVYARLQSETPDRPSIILGCVNVTGADVPGGYSSQPSPFLLGAYNLHLPEGPPSFSDPLVRAHFGWGVHYNTGWPFGGIQMMLTPKLGVAAFAYQGRGNYMVAYQANKLLSLRVGIKNSDPFYSAGLFFDW